MGKILAVYEPHTTLVMGTPLEVDAVIRNHARRGTLMTPRHAVRLRPIGPGRVAVTLRILTPKPVPAHRMTLTPRTRRVAIWSAIVAAVVGALAALGWLVASAVGGHAGSVGGAVLLVALVIGGTWLRHGGKGDTCPGVTVHCGHNGWYHKD